MGETHPDFAWSLSNLAGLYCDMGNYAAAEPLLRQALEICRRGLGEVHPHVATSLTRLAGLYHAMANYAAAEPLLREALEIRRRTLGEDHPDVAQSLNNLGALYFKTGNYGAAEPLQRQALEILRRALGDVHPIVATNLDNLGVLYAAMGNYAAAEPPLQQALENRHRILGETHPDVAESLNSLAGLYRAMGKYERAEPLYQQALEIQRRVLGEEHPDFAESLDALAVLYHDMGRYTAAEPLYRKALEIRRQVWGEAHPAFARNLNNLALVYKHIGNYTAAEPLYRRALQITRQTLGEAHPDFAVRLNNLAVFYKEIGDFAAAEPLYRQSLEIRGRTLGETHPAFAVALHNLALLYKDMGNYAAAERLYRQALEITRQSLGEAHPEFAAILNNLGGLHFAVGNYTEAEALCRQALEIARQSLGEAHPAFATSLRNLAANYAARGDYAAAESLYERAIEITRQALGGTHPKLADSLNALASLYIATSRPTRAVTLMEEAAAIDRCVMGQVFSIGSERQRMAYVDVLQQSFEEFLSLVSQHLATSSAAVQTALDLVLRRKAVGAEALAAQRDAVLGGRYPSLTPQLRELATLRMQIAQKTLAGPGPEGLETHQQLLGEWTARREGLEADLARHIPEMSLEQRLRVADRQAVAQALPPGAVLVEFVRFRVFDFHAVPARGEAPWKPARYLAFILPAGAPDGVRMVDLGDADDIDRQIAEFRAEITREVEGRGDPLGGGSWLSFSQVQPPRDGSALWETVFEPVVRTVPGASRFLLAPDGNLTRLPFEVLPLGDGRHVIDAYQISYLSTGRDVLRFSAAAPGEANDPMVVADPDFDLTAELREPPRPVGTGPTRTPGRHSRDFDRSTLRFPPLPGTRAEGERVARMLGVQPRLGQTALDGEVKAARSPRILHLATHGFFLADQARDPNQAGHGFEVRGEEEGELREWLEGPGLENPLLRSGLALAGVNTWLRRGSLPPEAEDGLLTAEGVSGLDLLNTELVVLSACDTGLGEIRTGEGVFGLRRAFVLTGAKTLVMSLWKVPDEETGELMADFYARVLAGTLCANDSETPTPPIITVE